MAGEVSGINMKLLIGIILFPVGIVLWFIPCFGTVLCGVCSLGAIILIVLGLMEMQKEKEEGKEKGAEKKTK